MQIEQKKKEDTLFIDKGKFLSPPHVSLMESTCHGLGYEGPSRKESP
jgi:hypothetical protein